MNLTLFIKLSAILKFIYTQMGNYESINSYIVNKLMQLYSTHQVSYLLIFYFFRPSLRNIIMTTFYRDVLIGLMFIVGIVGFISGEFIVSTVLFASAAISSNVYLNRQMYG